MVQHAIAGAGKRAAFSTTSTYERNFRLWTNFCTEFGFPIYIDGLSGGNQAEMVKSFAAYWFSSGNKSTTFKGKMAAVKFFHKKDRNARLQGQDDPELELMQKGFDRLSGPAEQKEPITRDMLRWIAERIAGHKGCEHERSILLYSVILGFFNLKKKSEVWKCGMDDRHVIRTSNVQVLDNNGRELNTSYTTAERVRITLWSSKAQQNKRPVTMSLFTSGSKWLCPVVAVVKILEARRNLQERETRSLGPWLTAVDQERTASARTVGKLIKQAATACEEDPCALLAAGYGEEVIKLMGRWSSWCFSIYTRLTAEEVADVAHNMRKAIGKTRDVRI